MPSLHLTTFIHAPAERVFDLSRSISLHKLSMNQSEERAIAGITSGLMDINDSVTWQAYHLFRKRILQMRISQMHRPDFFEDTMTVGDFKMLCHQHYFKSADNGTVLIDLLFFETPYGLLGKWLNKLYLTGYLKHLLQTRNRYIKEYAESEKWQTILN